MKEQEISIIIPVWNAETTVEKTLGSLFKQMQAFQELIIINDGSSDGSMRAVDYFLENNKKIISDKKINIIRINKEKSQGLAAAYNSGVEHSAKELVVTLHADIILKTDSLEKLVAPFFAKNSENIVAAYHSVDHPYEIWQQYNFWQKCFFSRLVGKKFSGLDGKFDCFRREALLQVGNFDAETFKNAGEDGDIVYKLGQTGKIVKSEAEIVHLHSMDPSFSFKNIVKKQKQYSESQGILLRKGRLKNLSLPKIFFRELLIASLLFPYVRIVSLILILIYSFMYTQAVFIKEYKNWRVLILPLLNIYLLLISLIFSVRGFIFGKQKIDA